MGTQHIMCFLSLKPSALPHARRSLRLCSSRTDIRDIIVRTVPVVHFEAAVR